MTTAADGRYVLDRLTAGQYQLEVEAPGYGAARSVVGISGAATRHDVILTSAGQLVITVTSPARRPLPGIGITVSSRTETEAQTVATTNAWGMVQLTNLTPGLYEVTLHAGDQNSPSSQNIVEIRSGEVARLNLIADEPLNSAP